MQQLKSSNLNRSVISAEQAEILVKPLVPEITVILEEALSLWQSCVATIPRLGLDDPKNQARATVISNFVTSEVKTKFNGRDGMRLNDDLGFILVVIDEKIAVRFKKLDRNLRPRNILTKQQSEFSMQALLPGFPPEATNLTFGYKLNSTGTALDGFYLQCPRGKRNVWSIPLDRPDDQPLFVAVQPDPVEPAPPVVRAKKSDSKKVAE